MKIETVDITIAPDDDGEKPTKCHYNSGNGQWKIEGPVHSRHLRILVELVKMFRESDAGQK